MLTQLIASSIAMMVILCTIAIALVVLSVVLVIICFRSKKAIHFIQTDVHKVSQELTRLLSSMNDFVETDLHKVSQETNHLISDVNAFSSDIKKKVDSFDFLFRPLSSLNSKLDSELSSKTEASSFRETIPQILKWIVSSVFLIKTTKEFIKHDK